MRCPLPPAQTGDTALHLASNKGRLDMVQLMIEHGAKLDVQNKVRRNGHTSEAAPASPARGRPCVPLRRCGMAGCLLLTICSPPSHSLQLGQTALHCAAGYGTVPLVKRLLDKGADKTVTDGVSATLSGTHA